MATSKTLKPTGTTVSIPAMTDRPNQSVNSNTMAAEADAINALMNILQAGSIANNTNLNTVDAQGIYLLPSSYSYTNGPSDSISILMVFQPNTGTTRLQIGIGLSSIFFRYRTNATDWLSWRKITSTADS